MDKLTLYTRPVCPLCEEAEELVELVAPQLLLDKIDIERDPQLVMRYGLRIPVLRRPDTDEELGWPFNAGQLEAFIAGR